MTHSDSLPTPFTAAEIKGASPAGLTLRYRVERRGQPPVIRVTRYASVDDDGAVRESCMESPDGTQLGEVERDTSTWHALQQHAAFPRANTVSTEDTIDIPAGRFACSCYTRVHGNETWRFWFARDLPGQPVRYDQTVDGEVVMSTSLISREAPRTPER